MTPTQFAQMVDAACLYFLGSLTSGRRTARHNARVGGVPNSPHVAGFGADVVYDVVPPLTDVMQFVEPLGLVVIREKDHDHFQPADWTPS